MLVTDTILRCSPSPPLIPLLCRPPGPSLPACSTAAILQNKSRDKCRSVSVSMDTGGLLQRLSQSLFTHAIVQGNNGSQTHAPSHTRPPPCTPLDSLGSADRCSVKHALIHKTHPVVVSSLVWIIKIFCSLCLKHLNLFNGVEK